MNTKLVMGLSAVLLALIAVIFIFLPEEVCSYIDASNGGTSRLFVQVLGGAYFGFAMLNWMTKASLIGGIYNRPIAIGNFAHFFIGALTLMKADVEKTSFLWMYSGMYCLFALAFGIILFNHPLKIKEA